MKMDDSYVQTIANFLHDVTFEGSSVDDPPCPDIEYGFMLPAPSSEKPSINDREKGLLTCLPTQKNTLPNKFSAALRSQLANYSMVTVRDVKDLLNSASFKGISNISIKNILIRDLSKVMVPEIGIGADGSVFDDFLGVIKEDPFKRLFQITNFLE